VTNAEFNGWAGEPPDLHFIRNAATSVAKVEPLGPHRAAREAPPLENSRPFNHPGGEI
jgi:hypothetical protein